MASLNKSKFPLVQAISTILIIACGLLSVILGVRTFISITRIITYMNNGVESMVDIPVLVAYKGVTSSPSFMIIFYIASTALYLSTTILCVASPLKTKLGSFQLKWHIMAIISLLLQVVFVAADLGVRKVKFDGFFSHEPFLYYMALIYAILSLFALFFSSRYTETEEEVEERKPITISALEEEAEREEEPVIIEEEVEPIVEPVINPYPAGGVSYVMKKKPEPETTETEAPKEEAVKPVFVPNAITDSSLTDFRSGMKIDISPLDRYTLCYLRHNRFIDGREFANGVYSHYKKKPYIVTLR